MKLQNKKILQDKCSLKQIYSIGDGIYSRDDFPVIIIDVPMLIDKYDGANIILYEQSWDILNTFLNGDVNIVCTYDYSSTHHVYSFLYDKSIIKKLDTQFRKLIMSKGFKNIIYSYIYNYRGIIRDIPPEYHGYLQTELFRGAGHIGGLIKDIYSEIDYNCENFVIINPSAARKIEKIYSLLNKYEEGTRFVPETIQCFSNLYDYEKTMISWRIETLSKHNDTDETKEQLQFLHYYKDEIINSKTRSCQKLRSYKMKSEAITILSSMGYQCTPQYTFDDLKDSLLLRYDIEFLDHHGQMRLLELDGEQHFKPVAFNGCIDSKMLKNYEITVKHDAMKNQYALDHNINLLRIPYDENIEERLFEWLSDDMIHHDN